MLLDKYSVPKLCTLTVIALLCCGCLETLFILTTWCFRADKLKEKEKELGAGAEEARRDFEQKQRSNYESLKTDEVLTLQESVNIDSLVSGQRAAAAAPVAPMQAAPLGAAGAAPGAAMPASYQMTAPLNEAELTALLMASPLYRKLEQIKKSLAGGAGAGKAHKLPEG